MRLNDELNNISTFDEEEYFKEYFKPMDISEEAKEEREEASEDIFDLLLFMFLLIDENLNNGAFTYNDLLMEFQRRYADIIATYGRNDSYFQSYLGLVPGEILDTTIKNLDNEYYTSRERAARIAVNEANTILNYEDLQKAIEAGMNVKIWHTMKDNRVREKHRELEGTKIGITEYFEVGQSRLLFPCDEVNCTNIRDIAGCRCYAKADFDPKYEQSQQNRVEKPFENDKIKENKVNHYTLKNSELTNGLPKEYKPNSIVDKADDNNVVLQRRVYDEQGKAKVDYDTSDHNRPDAHPTGAHKHIWDFSKKKPRQEQEALTEEELEANKDIIQRGVNYHDS